MQLETNVHDMQIKMKEKEQSISKINKKYNCLREKVTLLFERCLCSLVWFPLLCFFPYLL